MESHNPARLRLLIYNVQVGIPTRKYRHYFTHSWKHVLPFPARRDNLDRIADFVARFDIVGLVETDAGSIRSEFIHQPEYVARRAGFDHCYSRVNRDLGIVAQHSLALLSRYPAHAVREHRLPSTIPGRGALEAHFGDPADPLVVVLAHLSLSARARIRQLRYLSRLVAGYRHAVLMGDLNAELDSPELAELLRVTHLVRPAAGSPTYPSWRPRAQYDHILATPDLRPGDSEVYRIKHSDHLPVGLEVEFAGLRAHGQARPSPAVA